MPTREYLAKESLAFRRTLTGKSEVEKALRSSSFLDARLEALLRRFFVGSKDVIDDLLGRNRPLSSFSSRIDLTFALGLISSQVRRDLHLIRDIRNRFGHEHREITFSDAKVRSWCLELYHTLHSRDESPDARFTNAVMGVLSQIDSALARARRRKVPDDWKIDERDREAMRAKWCVARGKRSKTDT